MTKRTTIYTSPSYTYYVVHVGVNIFMSIYQITLEKKNIFKKSEKSFRNEIGIHFILVISNLASEIRNSNNLIAEIYKVEKRRKGWYAFSTFEL